MCQSKTTVVKAPSLNLKSGETLVIDGQEYEVKGYSFEDNLILELKNNCFEQTQPTTAPLTVVK